MNIRMFIVGQCNANRDANNAKKTILILGFTLFKETCMVKCMVSKLDNNFQIPHIGKFSNHAHCTGSQ